MDSPPPVNVPRGASELSVEPSGLDEDVGVMSGPLKGGFKNSMMMDRDDNDGLPVDFSAASA